MRYWKPTWRFRECRKKKGQPRRFMNLQCRKRSTFLQGSRPFADVTRSRSTWPPGHRGSLPGNPPPPTYPKTQIWVILGARRYSRAKVRTINRESFTASMSASGRDKTMADGKSLYFHRARARLPQNGDSNSGAAASSLDAQSGFGVDAHPAFIKTKAASSNPGVKQPSNAC